MREGEGKMWESIRRDEGERREKAPMVFAGLPGKNAKLAHAFTAHYRRYGIEHPGKMVGQAQHYEYIHIMRSNCFYVATSNVV